LGNYKGLRGERLISVVYFSKNLAEPLGIHFGGLLFGKGRGKGRASVLRKNVVAFGGGHKEGLVAADFYLVLCQEKWEGELQNDFFWTPPLYQAECFGSFVRLWEGFEGERTPGQVRLCVCCLFDKCARNCRNLGCPAGSRRKEKERKRKTKLRKKKKKKRRGGKGGGPQGKKRNDGPARLVSAGVKEAPQRR